MKKPRTCNRCWALEGGIQNAFWCQLDYPVKTTYAKHTRNAKPVGPCPKPITSDEWLAERKKLEE